MRSFPTGSGTHDWAAMPRALLSDLGLRPRDKLLYAAIQLLPNYWFGLVETTYQELRTFTDLNHSTLKNAMNALVGRGWLAVSQPKRRQPLLLTLQNPAADIVQQAIEAVRRRLDQAPFLGEALMREYLNLLVDSDEYDDNASPGFLINPYTGEEMQFDRYYPPFVAFEFNGPQHYGPTAIYPDQAEVRKQQGRDLMKRGICAARGIHLIYIHPEDLSLEGMLRKIQGLLPLRSLDGQEELIAYLESRARPYRRKAGAPQ